MVTEMSCGSSSPGKWRKWYVPQSACCMMNRSSEASSCCRCLRGCKVGCQGRKSLRIVARIVGEFDCYRLRGALWNGSVQFLDGPLCLHSLIESNKSHTFGQTCSKNISNSKYFKKGTHPPWMSSWERLPVMLSQRMRDVMILPKGLNRDSNSCCVKFLGSPLTYKLAPLMASLLGLA